MKTKELKKPSFRNKKNFELFLKEIDAMGEFRIREIMGDDYIDTPGFYKQEKKDYNNDIMDFMLHNMGRKELDNLHDWWVENVKK
jgi:hypothetical protein